MLAFLNYTNSYSVNKTFSNNDVWIIKMLSKLLMPSAAENIIISFHAQIKISHTFYAI